MGKRHPRVPQERAEEVPPLGNPDDLVPIKVRRKSIRLLKLAAEFKGLFLADFVHELAVDAVKLAAPSFLEEVKHLGGKAPP